MIENYSYKTGNIILLPYTPGVGVFTENILVEMYSRMHEDGIWDTVFHEDTSLSMLKFMNFFSDGKALLQILAIMNGEQLVDIIGLSWVADVVSCGVTRGTGSFAFFKEYQKPAYTDLSGELILRYWFDELKLDLVMGVTPEKNRASRAYISRLGFKDVGRIPKFTIFNGEVDNGFLAAMTKDEWMAISAK